MPMPSEVDELWRCANAGTPFDGWSVRGLRAQHVGRFSVTFVLGRELSDGAYQRVRGGFDRFGVTLRGLPDLHTDTLRGALAEVEGHADAD